MFTMLPCRSTLVQFVSPLTAFKIIIYMSKVVRKESPNIQSNHELNENCLEKLNFINLNRYPICRVVVEPRARTAFQVSIDS